MLWPLRNRVFFVSEKIDVTDTVGAQGIAGTLPTRSAHASWLLGAAAQTAEQARPSGLDDLRDRHLDRSRFVFRFGLMALPTSESMPASAPVGSAPLRTVNGAPLWA